MYRSTFSLHRYYLEVSGQLCASAALPPGKEPRYPLDRRLGGLQNRSVLCGDEKSHSSSAGVKKGGAIPQLPHTSSWRGA
jgi:hypothetical protein